MDNFLGCKIKLRMGSKDVFGILKDWDSAKEEVRIKKESGEEVIDIGDISDIELCDLENTNKMCEYSENINKMCEYNENHINHKLCNEIIALEDNQNIPIVDNQNNSQAYSDINLPVQVKQTINELTVNTPANSNLEGSPLTPQLSYTAYMNLLQDCFTVFGPSKEEFCTSVSLSIFKILKARLNTKFITLKMGSNTLYNCIGYKIARILELKGYGVNIIEGSEDIEVIQYKYMFNAISTNSESNNGVLVNFSEEEVEGFDIVFGINSRIFNCINLLLGCVIEGCQDSKEAYLIDIYCCNKVYKKYGIENRFEKTGIIRIKK